VFEVDEDSRRTKIQEEEVRRRVSVFEDEGSRRIRVGGSKRSVLKAEARGTREFRAIREFVDLIRGEVGLVSYDRWFCAENAIFVDIGENLAVWMTDLPLRLDTYLCLYRKGPNILV
jgi:hypothetical protein